MSQSTEELKVKIQKELAAYMGGSSMLKPLTLLMKESSEWLKTKEK